MCFVCEHVHFTQEIIERQPRSQTYNTQHTYIADVSCFPVLTLTYSAHYISPPPSREVEFIQKEDAERRRLEEAEKAHLAEIQGLQVRVKHPFFILSMSVMTVFLPQNLKEINRLLKKAWLL